ncbi:hypothetical protein [Dysgonomonas sp. ZJ279]|uniref:hypothetical protein n=1 Tax=Dysgonomonas sp. ZJ279 TaxID=2709796 RepID=UPI0013E9D138|nr:hypothetical protein [Dysgonomonas sp. ZJ279]
MKRFLKVMTCLLFLMGCVFMVLGQPISAAGLLIAAPPVVLDTQTIVFLTSLKEEYQAIDTWLKEAEDLSSFVEDGQTLVFPEGGEDPLVYKNRVTDIDSVEPEETVHKVALDVYDSQNYKLRNIFLHALPFEKVQFYTRKSANAIVRQEIEDSAHNLTPESVGNKRIVIGSTGISRNTDGTTTIITREGLKVLCLDDIVTLARACDNQEFPDEGRNLVLPSDMWWDLVNNNSILKGQMERLGHDGTIKPLIVEYYGFKIHKSTQKLKIGYDIVNRIKAPQGTIITNDIVPAGFVFIRASVFRASGMFELFRKVKSQNTSGRAEEFGFQHRFKSDFQMSAQRYSAMIYMDKA